MRKLLPVLLTLLGLAVGGGVGLLLQPGAADGAQSGGKGNPAPADGMVATTANGYGGEVAADGGQDAVQPATPAGYGDGGKPAPDDSIEVIPAAADGDGGKEGGAGVEYVKLSNQFIVPLVENGQVVSMMVLTLSLEVRAGGGDAVYAREPKLRDALLQVLFDHANANGFAGRYTDAEAMMPLRRALREAAVKVLPDTVTDVLISDIVRRDG